MKKYDVFGIGNALVDCDFEVDDSMLAALTVDKGLMTLIDERRYRELMTLLANKPHKRTCGGSAANTMIALSQLGGRAFYACKVGNDPAGHFYLQDLLNQGVSYHIDPDKLMEGHTGSCFVFVTPDADRTMNSYVGVSNQLSVADISPEAIIASETVYIEGYLVPSPTARAAAMETKAIATANGVKTALSLSDPNMTVHFKNELDALIGNGVDFLFCNEDEALCYTKSHRLEDAISAFQKLATQFAITRGPKGALLYDGRQCHDIPATPIKPLDTVGAGDVFAAAMLFGLSHHIPICEAAIFANEAAEQIVSQIGPRLTAEQAAFLARRAAQLTRQKESA